MMIIIGLLLIPFVMLILKRLSIINVKKREKVLLNFILLFLSFVFIILCFTLHMEPFDFKIDGLYDYILYTAVIYVFTPFLWIITIYYGRSFLRNFRVKKNARIKKERDFDYYREDLDKISPSMIMFTSIFDIDFKASISATILKLKLTGYIQEKDGLFELTNKTTTHLLESEKMILNYVNSHTFDKNLYKKIVEKEAINRKYVRKNRGGIVGRFLKIICAILITLIAYHCSFQLDHYVFENYHIRTENDGYKYIHLKNDVEIENLYYNEIKDETDYYGRIITIAGKDRMSYSYDLIRADKLKYGVVRKAIILNFLVPISILFCIVWSMIALYIIIEQFLYMNKNYTRTLKGNDLLNKAYALKNYLKDFSIIRDRKEEEIQLWEYYLVYAVVLGVNVKIQDEMIGKYIKE